MHLTRQQFWILLVVETVFLALLAAWILQQYDRLFEPTGIVVALGIIVAGDVASALLLQRYAPTRITLHPGEASRSLAEVLSGFDGSPTGEVAVKGERWQAHNEGTGTLVPGDRVDIVARAGLTLYVRPID
jgi:membrane-bound ClpP family serine protease